MFNLALWWSTWGHQIHVTGGTSYSSLLLKAGLTYSRLLRALSRLVLNTSEDGRGTASLGPAPSVKSFLVPGWSFPCCNLWPLPCPFAVTLSRGTLGTILGMQPEGAGNEHRRPYSGPALTVHLEVSHPSPFKGRCQKPSIDKSRLQIGSSNELRPQSKHKKVYYSF